MRLHSQLIKLAYDNPEYRKDLLPLLMKHAGWAGSGFSGTSNLLEREITQGYSSRKVALEYLIREGSSDPLSDLTAWARKAANLFDPHVVGSTVWAKDVAIVVGRYAKRQGYAWDQVSKWLQGSYGEIWVKLGIPLDPGLDLKEVREWILKGYNR